MLMFDVDVDETNEHHRYGGGPSFKREVIRVGICNQYLKGSFLSLFVCLMKSLLLFSVIHLSNATMLLNCLCVY